MPQESFVKLRFKFVLPINLILVVIPGFPCLGMVAIGTERARHAPHPPG